MFSNEVLSKYFNIIKNSIINLDSQQLLKLFAIDHFNNMARFSRIKLITGRTIINNIIVDARLSSNKYNCPFVKIQSMHKSTLRSNVNASYIAWDQATQWGKKGENRGQIEKIRKYRRAKRVKRWIGEGRRSLETSLWCRRYMITRIWYHVLIGQMSSCWRFAVLLTVSRSCHAPTVREKNF